MILNFSSDSFQNQHNVDDQVKYGFYIDGPYLTWTTIAAGFI